MKLIDLLKDDLKLLSDKQIELLLEAGLITMTDGKIKVSKKTRIS